VQASPGLQTMPHARWLRDLVPSVHGTPRVTCAATIATAVSDWRERHVQVPHVDSFSVRTVRSACATEHASSAANLATPPRTASVPVELRVDLRHPVARFLGRIRLGVLHAPREHPRARGPLGR